MRRVPSAWREPDLTGFRRRPVGSGGWLMSVFWMAAILLAVPAALLLTRLGSKITELTALSFTVFGASSEQR